MYKLIVVDDKADITEGIIKLGKWSEMGFVAVGKAFNGRDAFELVKQHHPDVVITDIRMPVMDGLELTSLIKVQYPFTKVIILSGYDDFKYAQQAVKLGAEEYLLKPARIDMIEEAVLRAYEKLEAERKKKEESIMLQQKLIQSLPYLKDEYFRQLVSRPFEDDPEETKRKFQFLEIGLETENFSVLFVELDNYRELYEQKNIKEVELYKFAVANIAQEIMSEFYKCEVFRFRESTVVILLNFLSSLNPCENKARIIEAAEKIRQSIEKYLEVTVTIGIGGLYSGLKDIYSSFLDAKDAIAHKIYLGPNHVIFSEDVKISHRSAFHYPVQLEGEIISALKIGAADKLPQTLGRFLDSILSQKEISPAHFKKLIREFVVLVTRMTPELSENDALEGDDFIAELDKYKTVEEIRSWLEKILCDKARAVRNMRKSQIEQDICKARVYIDNHYNEEISLQSVSEHVCLSPTYFSSVFKEVVGETFIEYLIKTRIEKAKELLLSGDYKIYEIANKVGYEDRRYFSEVFKKHTGLNPAEYVDKEKSS